MTTETDNPLDQSLMGTMKIDPNEYSPKRNRDRIDGAKAALSGLLYLIRWQQSVQILLFVTFLAVILGLWLQIDRLSFLVMLLSLGLVWTTEALNTAVEAVVDLASPEIHPMAKVSKDVAAAATFLAAALSAGITLVIIIPPLVDRLNG